MIALLKWWLAVLLSGMPEVMIEKLHNISNLSLSDRQSGFRKRGCANDAWGHMQTWL